MAELSEEGHVGSVAEVEPGLLAILVAASHPHLFGAQVAWGERFDAPVWVGRSAERYVGWVRGDFDHLAEPS